MIENDVRILVARLLTHRVIKREDPLAVRALTDEAFRHELDSRLEACGLVLLDNPYAGHIAVGLQRRMEGPVFGGDEAWGSNNLGLDRDAVALLVILWALLVLPKRQRQIERKQRDEARDQTEMFAEDKPLPRGPEVAGSVRERTLIADFGDKLGKATRIKINLGQLARLGFIVRRQEEIHEGPLLDLALDYNRMAGRVLDGALSDLLGTHLTDVMPEAAGDV